MVHIEINQFPKPNCVKLWSELTMNGKAGTKLKNNLDRREVKSAMITCDIRGSRVSRIGTSDLAEPDRERLSIKHSPLQGG